MFPRAWASLYRLERHNRRSGGNAGSSGAGISASTLSTAAESLVAAAAAIELSTFTHASELHFKVKGARSQKSWVFFGNDDCVYQLLLSLVVVDPLEKIMWEFFGWQRDATYLHNAISDVPLVMMANMSVSPATEALDSLSKLMCLNPAESDDFLVQAADVLPACRRLGWLVGWHPVCNCVLSLPITS
jgi:hypothetical protein